MQIIICADGASLNAVVVEAAACQFDKLLLLPKPSDFFSEVAPFMCEEKKKVVTVTAFPMRMPSVFLSKLYYSKVASSSK